tara:strand:- start:47 stop:196 length:150 start_codon:yes stop_codon:yes gene_type:complete
LGFARAGSSPADTVEYYLNKLDTTYVSNGSGKIRDNLKEKSKFRMLEYK